MDSRWSNSPKDSILQPLGIHGRCVAVHASLQSALSKAAAALPPEGLVLVQQLEGTFSVGLGPHKRYKHHRDIVERVTHAIAEKKRIQMRYDSASRGRVTRREVDPYRLWYAAGGLYLIAYCHLRQEPRMFAVERIKSVTPTDVPYQSPHSKRNRRHRASSAQTPPGNL